MSFSSRVDNYAAVGHLIDGLEGDKFWLNLCRFLERQITFDQLAVFSYEWSDAPKRIFDLHPSPKRDHLHNDLLSAAYLIGPYYNNLVKIQVDDGFYHIDEIAPDAFRDSEYYRIYYSEKHAADEGMFYVRLGSGLSIGLLMERSKPSPAFTDEEMKSLRSVASLVGALARRRWKLVDAPAHRDSDMGEQMVTALECFGSDLLSNPGTTDRRIDAEGSLIQVWCKSPRNLARDRTCAPKTTLQ